MKIFSNKIPYAPIALLFKMAYQNGGVSFRRLPVFMIYILHNLLLEPFRLAELILYDKKIKCHELSQAPIFILGHWRSGTSFSQSLFCQDPKLTSSTIFRSLNADNFYLTESWLKPAQNFICKLLKIPYSIQRMPMDLDIPSEADMALCVLSSELSYTWGQVFPKRFEQWVEKLILFRDEKIASDWIQKYDYFIRKLSYQANGKRVVVKSPGDTGRVAYLIKQYPKARFIYIHRNPISVFHSNLYLWKVLQKQNCLQIISDSAIEALIINGYKQVMQSYLKQRDLIPASQLIELRFEEIKKSPLKELKKAYNKMGLGSVPEKEITSFLRENQSHKPSASYSTSPFLEKKLKKEWGFAFEEWPLYNE